MQSSDDGNTRYFLNIFLRDFLERLGARDEPRAAAEADVAGPWRVEEVRATLYAVFRKGESTLRGDRPAAVLYDRAPALLLAALLPGTGREPLFHLRPDPTPKATPSSPAEKSSATSPSSTTSSSRPSTPSNASCARPKVWRTCWRPRER